MVGTRGVLRSGLHYKVKMYMHLQSTCSANELVFFRMCVDLGMIREVGLE